MISAVILTRDEEQNIRDCIKSLNFCDEILIIDDNSIDNTSEIAQSLGAVVYHRDLNNDFASQRNFGLEKAKNEWVIFIDADERISPMLADEIKSLCYPSKIEPDKIQNKIYDLEWQDKNLVKGFYIKRKDILFGKLLEHGETGDIKFIRLGKRDAGKWKRKVHEVWEIQGRTDTLKNEMSHNPHPTLTAFLQAINQYSTINAQEFIDQGVKVGFWQILVYPVGKFLRNYLLLRGFLDGTPGFIQAMIMSFHSFLTRGKIWTIQNKFKQS